MEDQKKKINEWKSHVCPLFFVGFHIPDHNKKTNYRYNSLNALIEQHSVDGGTTKFYYDKIGRLRFSQNEKQLQDNKYSYTKYDAFGRIVEVGESNLLSSDGDFFYRSAEDNTFPGYGEQVTRTFYDKSINTTVNGYFTEVGAQSNLRSRVVTVAFFDKTTISQYKNASHFSYDIHGNVNYLVQENNDLKNTPEQIKTVAYKYDLVSGNVNEVQYQKGKADQFYHKYYYDADNRITQVETSNNGVVWEEDAEYFYYLHGPLARTELGDEKVQGLDYVYNLNGWLKGINSTTRVKTRDLGKDGMTASVGDANAYLTSSTSIHSRVAEDAIGYNINYFNGDYTPINNTKAGAVFASIGNSGHTALGYDDNQMFNGNISWIANSLQAPQGSNEQDIKAEVNLYKYDQLNRFVNSAVFDGSAAIASNTLNAVATEKYGMGVRYDADGNIQQLSRRGKNSTDHFQPDMDNLTYRYKPGTNQLVNVVDAITTNAYGNDYEYSTLSNLNDNSPGAWQYEYDKIGNLISDKSEEILKIEWTVYGKVSKVIRWASSTKPDLEFIYDASGNRITKIVKPKATNGSVLDVSEWLYTDYVRDASGNVMATYERKYEINTMLPPEGMWTGMLQLVGELNQSNQLTYNILIDGSWILAQNGVWYGANALDNFITGVNQNSTNSGISASSVPNCVGCVQLTSLIQHQSILGWRNNSAGYFAVNEIKPFQLNLNTNINLTERKLSDHHIYGSKRLGIEERNLLLPIQSTYIHHDDFMSNITGWHPFEPSTQVTHEFHKLKLTTNQLYAKAYRNFATEPGQTYKITLEVDKGTAQAAGFLVYSSTSNPEVLGSIASIAATGTYTVNFEAKSPVSSLQLMNLDGSGSTVDIYLLDMKVELVNGGIIARNRGDKRYELTNHLGDVMSTVTDRKIISASAQADELLQTGYEGGDYTLFANNQSYASMQTTDPNVLNASNHVILLDPAANGGAHYAPYIKRQVTYGDKIDISCNTWWVNTTSGGGAYNRGGSITYTLEDQAGHRLLHPDGTEYWAELRVGASGLDANQWVTLSLPNYEIPLPSQLRTYNNKNVLYTGNVYITVIPWNAAPTNKTYYDDLSVTIDRNQSAAALYAAEVMSASTYYPFGMTQWSAGSNDYLYGNDGQAKTPELGEGHYTAEYWEYDSRLGR